MKSKKILIVDDNDLNRKYFENLVRQWYGYKLAKNGMEALELAQNETFDLILMDIQMPYLDGVSTMKKIRKQSHESCPIIAVTAYASEADRKYFLDQGFEDFIVKPSNTKELLGIIRKLLNKNTLPESSQPEKPMVLNVEVIRRLLKYNSKETVRGVYKQFMDECEEILKEADLYQSQKEMSYLVSKIHTLKGNSGTLGVQRVYEISVQCEANGRCGKWEEFRKDLVILKNAILEFQRYFEQDLIFDL